MRTYYTLAVRENGYWSEQFGDWDKECVEVELDDYASGFRSFKKKDMKIIKTNGKQASINAAIAKLNS